MIEFEFRRDKVIEIFEEFEKNDIYCEVVERVIMKVKKVKDEEEIRRIFREIDEKFYEEVRVKFIDVFFDELVEVMYGFVGVDLVVFVREVVMVVFRRFINEGKIDFEVEYILKEVFDEFKVMRRDFYEVFKMVELLVFREVFLEVLNVCWDDIGGFEDVK